MGNRCVSPLRHRRHRGALERKLLEGTNRTNGGQRSQMGPNGPLGGVRVGKSTGSSWFYCEISRGGKTLFSIGTIVSSNGRQAAIWGVARVLYESE